MSAIRLQKQSIFCQQNILTEMKVAGQEGDIKKNHILPEEEKETKMKVGGQRAGLPQASAPSQPN